MNHIGVASWRMCVLAGIAAGLLGVGATPASAETLTFRNDSNVAIVVQVTGVFRGVLQRERPHLLLPGESTQPGIVLLGDKVIAIFDAKSPNHLLFESALAGGTRDHQFHIVADPTTSGVRLQGRFGRVDE